MKNNALISERMKVDMEIIAVSSAAGNTSLNYDMQGYEQALLAVDVYAAGAGFTTCTLDLMQSSAATVAGSSAAGSKAGIVIGGPATNLPVAGGAREITLTMTSCTSGAFFNLKAGNVVKKFIYTTSTELYGHSSAWVSTALYFGSTEGSTVEAGLQLALDQLKTAIASTLAFGNSLVLSTGSTVTITIKAADAVVGNLGMSDTADMMAASVQQAVGAFDISVDQMASTANKRYIGVKVSTLSTAAQAAVTVIRAGGSYLPPTFSGKLSS
jgi:hypothetical protein